MTTLSSLGLRHVATVAALSLTLGVAACNEEGGDDMDQTGASPTAPADPAAPDPMSEPAPVE